MKTFAVLVTCLSLCLWSSAAWANVIVGFDAADSPAVDAGDGATATWNAGAYWDYTSGGDWGFAAFAYPFGDVTGMTFTVDLKGNFGGSRDLAVCMYNDSTGWAGRFAHMNVPATPDWTTYTIDLVEADWDDWGGDWQDVVGNVTGLEFYFLAPSGSFDNAGFVPEPAALLLLTAGGAAVLRRRRK